MINSRIRIMISPEEWRSELATRRAAVWSIVQQHDCDLGLIYGGFGHAEPFRYLTNFVPVLGDSFGIVTGPDTMACVLNFAWQLEEARQISGLQEWYGQFNPIPTLVDLLSARTPKRIGIVGLHRLPVPAYEAIKAALPDATLVDIG